MNSPQGTSYEAKLDGTDELSMVRSSVTGRPVSERFHIRYRKTQWLFSGISGLSFFGAMSTHAGVHCAKCSRVHFLATLKRIPEATTKGLFQITCPPPCGAVTYFRLEDMRAFSVLDSVYERGYAEPGQYEAALSRKVS
jgi:hypothetical protein